MPMSETKTPLLKGLVAATFTPMKSTGALDLQRIPAVCDFVLGQGVDGLFVCGGHILNSGTVSLIPQQLHDQ